MNKETKGFTLVEIVVVVGIIAVILGVVLASISSSKDKSADAETKKVVSELAIQAEGKDIAPGVMDYEAAFSKVDGYNKLLELASKYNIDPGAFQYLISPKSYAIVFPLKKGGYYCIDSVGHATGIEIPNLFGRNDPHNCLLAAGFAGAGGGVGGGAGFPTLSLPSAVDYCGDTNYCTKIYSELGISTVVAKNSNLMGKIGDLLAQAERAVTSAEQPQQVFVEQSAEESVQPVDNGGVGVEPVDGGGSNTVSIGVTIGIDPNGNGAQISEYLSKSITASDAEDGDLTSAISIENIEPSYLNFISGGSEYYFNKTPSMFPRGAGGMFSGCSSPYAFKYSVTDNQKNTTSQIQEYMTCSSVKFDTFDPVDLGGTIKKK